MNLIEVLILKAELLPLNYNNHRIFKSDKVKTKLPNIYRIVFLLCHMFHLRNDDMFSWYIDV